jgi:hypothetical protein
VPGMVVGGLVGSPLGLCRDGLVDALMEGFSVLHGPRTLAFTESRVGQALALVQQSDGAVECFAHHHLGMVQAAGALFGLYLVERVLVVRFFESVRGLCQPRMRVSSEALCSTGRWASCAERGVTAKRRLWCSRNCSKKSFAASIALIPRRRSTRRSCSVWLARSTRPLACGVWAWMASMSRVPSARLRPP